MFWAPLCPIFKERKAVCYCVRFAALDVLAGVLGKPGGRSCALCAPACIGTVAPSSGNFDIAFAKVIRY